MFSGSYGGSAVVQGDSGDIRSGVSMIFDDFQWFLVVLGSGSGKGVLWVRDD